MITDDGECTTEFRTRLNKGQAIGASREKIWKIHSIRISTKIRLMKALVWPATTYGYMKAGLSERMKKHFLTEKDSAGFVDSKENNEWVLNKAGVKRELFDIVKARKLAYYGHTMRKQGNSLVTEIMQGTMPGARRRGRARTA